MSVVGFDVGNENCVIAIAKQRGIDVLLNDESKRETPSMVCFGEKQRFLGSAGAASAMMNPKSTISQVKRLIGWSYMEPDIQKDLKMFPFETSEAPDGGILIHLKYLGETHSFTTVQIMGMLLGHLKDVTEKNVETPISDCVIGIPSYFTDIQRRAYLNAAAIAGLRPLRLMHDCTAIALSYGIYKTDLAIGGLTHVAFVDIGHCDSQVSIVSFEAGHMRVLSHTFDRNLGGRDFDEVLFSHFATQFKEQYSIDVYSNIKACTRLRSACEKLKKVLSANAEAPLNIECLMDEKDVKGFIKREDFEKLSFGLLERITIPCRKALGDAGLTVERIHSVELVGSGSRIPAINRLLTSFFGREPSRTLNASECVARGCALQCAMLSPIFRVREYEVQDTFPFSIGFSLDGGPISKGSDGVLFPRGQSFPSAKVLTFQRSNLFYLEAFYVSPDELPAGVPLKISYFTIGPLQGSHNEKSRVKIRVQLNLHGIVTIESATLIDDQVENSISSGDAHSKGQKVDSESVSISGYSEINANDVEDSTLDKSKASHASADGMREGKITKKLAIPISEHIYGGMSKAELLESQEKELQLAQQDITMEQTKEKKNALESYVYDMRNKILNTYQSFATDCEKEGISTSLQQTEDWLYEDGDDETESAYISRLEDLKKLLNPIENRYKDEEARAQATRDLLKRIADYQMSVDSLSPKDREMMIDECNKAQQWLREKTQLQESMPKNNDPVVWSTDIKCKEEDFDTACKHILRSKASH